MTDLDRLLELGILLNRRGFIEFNEAMKLEHEYESLKAKIEGMIEDGKFVKSWVKEYGQGNKDYLKQMYYDLESQVAEYKMCAEAEAKLADSGQKVIAKLKETCGLCAEEQIKLKEELEYMTDTNITGARNSAYFAHENGKLKSTLDEIKTLAENPNFTQNGNDYVDAFNLKKALAKHEGKK